MKFKKEIMILSLILVMLFAVSSVCAVDSEIDISTHNTMGTVNDKILKMNDANEILAETYDFNALNYTINSNTSSRYIELEKDYHGSFDNNNGILINRSDIVINGKRDRIDSSGENSGIFNIIAPGITLKNI